MNRRGGRRDLESGRNPVNAPIIKNQKQAKLATKDVSVQACVTSAGCENACQTGGKNAQAAGGENAVNAANSLGQQGLDVNPEGIELAEIACKS